MKLGSSSRRGAGATILPEALRGTVSSRPLPGSILAATAVALISFASMFVAVAPAAAAGTAKVKIEGTGQGEVSSVGGIGAFRNAGGENDATFESFGNELEGSPPIECKTPAPGVGTCETALVTFEALGLESIALHAIPAAGSEFVGWVIEEGGGSAVGCEVGGTFTEAGENPTFCLQAPAEGSGNIRLTAIFGLEGFPSVTKVEPAKGLAAGGNTVEITGTNLAEAKEVKFGETAATIVENTETLIKVIAPAHVSGVVDVRVVNAIGESATGAGDKYTYMNTPVVTNVNPTGGPVAGGNVVEITGVNLGSATAVHFGALEVSAPFKLNLGTKIVVTAPAHAAGTVDVTVTTARGDSPVSVGDKYTYVEAPTIGEVSPTQGPTGGGTKVRVKGTDLLGASFRFGANLATAVNVLSATEAEVSAPAGAAGTVDVIATTSGGTSAASGAAKFTYVAPLAFSVTTAGGGSGTVTCNGGACASSYALGTTVTLAAVASSGSTFGGFSGGGCSGTTCTLVIAAGTSVTATFNNALQCKVPKLKGLSLGKARSALAKAHCKVGKVVKPKAGSGSLVVKSSTPKEGAKVAADTKVGLRLGSKSKNGR